MFYNNHMLNIIIKLQTSFKIRTRDGHRFSKLKTNEIFMNEKLTNNGSFTEKQTIMVFTEQTIFSNKLVKNDEFVLYKKRLLCFFSRHDL